MLSVQAQALTRERQKLEAEAAQNKSQQSTMSKAVKNLVRQARTVVEQIHETEMGKKFHTSDLSDLSVPHVSL